MIRVFLAIEAILAVVAVIGPVYHGNSPMGENILFATTSLMFWLAVIVGLIDIGRELWRRLAH